MPASVPSTRRGATGEVFRHVVGQDHFAIGGRRCDRRTIFGANLVERFLRVQRRLARRLHWERPGSAKLYRNDGRATSSTRACGRRGAQRERRRSRQHGCRCGRLRSLGRPHIVVGNFVNGCSGSITTTTARSSTMPRRALTSDAPACSRSPGRRFPRCRSRWLPRHLRGQRRHR